MRYIDRDKQQGDPWLPEDANQIPIASEDYQVALELEHSDEGEHHLPAPAAAALVLWNGTTYSVAWSEGITSVVREGTGLLRVTLARPMIAANRWILTGQPLGPDCGGAEEVWNGDGAKTQLVSRIQLFADKLTHVDSSVLLAVWGEFL